MEPALWGVGRPTWLIHPRSSGLSLPRTKTGPGGHSSVWEVPHQMSEGGKNPIFLAFFFSFYFLIIFLDDFISKNGVGERRRTGGGSTGGLRRDEMGSGCQAQGKIWGNQGPPCPGQVPPAQTVSPPPDLHGLLGQLESHKVLGQRSAPIQPGLAGEGLLGASLWGMTSLPHRQRSPYPLYCSEPAV